MKKDAKNQGITPRELEVFRKVVAVLKGEYGEEAREYLHQHMLSFKRYCDLKDKGINVYLPAPRLGHPRFLVIRGNTRN
jgi:hypothetical protein